MPSLFSKALLYLGLVDEDQPDYDPEPSPEPAPRATQPEPTYAGENRTRAHHRIEGVSPVEGRRVEPPRNPIAERSSGVRAIRPVEIQSDVILVEEFGDAKILADRVRDKVPVVLDLRSADPNLVRRVIDFSSGLIYALDGTMRKVGEGLVLVLPPRVTLSRDEKRRLAGLGVYELSDID